MRSPLFNSCLKGLLQVALAVTLTLEANAQGNSSEPFSEAETLEFDKSIDGLKKYLETLQLYDVTTLLGSTHKERLNSQDRLYQSLANDLVLHGINTDKLLKIAESDASAKKLVVSYQFGEARFEDYLRLAEIAVIARVGDAVPNSPMTFAGPGFFELDVSDNLSSTSSFENIVVVNALNAHHRTLHTGRECVFFLSPTYTKSYVAPGKKYPNLPEYLREGLPDNFLTSRFSTYCTKDGEIFARGNWGIGGADEITRSEILGLAKTIP